MMTVSLTIADAAESPAGGGASAGCFVLRPAHLNSLLRQVSARSHGRVVVVQAGGGWAGGRDVQVDGVSWRVVYVSSQLAVREALVTHEEAGPEDRLVILTPLDTLALGMDVRARIVKQRVFTLHAWELLNDLFRARSVDPRVARLSWLGDVLLEMAPPSGYAPAPSGVLDLETAWSHAFGALLGLSAAAPDPLTLLRWSTRDGSSARWATLTADARGGLTARLSETAGPLGEVLTAALQAGNGGRLIALGLVCDVLWPGDEQQRFVSDKLRDTLTAARVRLEPHLGGRVLSPGVAREWAVQAHRVLGEISREQVAEQRRHAEQLLEELRATDALLLSRVLPGAVSRRATKFANAITDVLERRGSPEAVLAAYSAFAEHVDVAADAGRVLRSTMAIRVLRALQESEGAGDAGLGTLVRQQVSTGSWLDAARTSLLGGDSCAELAGAYAALLARARARREVETLLFAERLVKWNETPNAEPEVMPVERVVELTVAPIADVRPVLVVLMDGLDMGVWRALRADLSARHWTWWQPTAATTAPVALATLPSVTSASRASLFAGTVKSGNQSTEKPDFASHPSLRRSIVNNRAPVLFHKAELGSGNALAPELRRALDDRQQRVIGVVINAVDDLLDKSEQVLPRWGIAAVPLLDALLQEAALAERAVIMLSDHGHILDHDTVMQRASDGARWRVGDASSVGPGEVVARGPRVRAACGHDAVVLAASEALRYTAKKTGYHGGASPQEVIAPVAVLSRDALGVEGWRPVIDSPPEWWQPMTTLSEPQARVEAGGLVVGTPSSAVAHAGSVPSTTPVVRPAWIETMLTSQMYASQRALVGRSAPSDDQAREFLAALAQGQGRTARTTIASALAMPEMRVRGLTAGMRRLLNIEGFAVLEEEDGTGMLLLNIELLRKQFGLSE
jgi:hypothetical protein